MIETIQNNVLPPVYEQDPVLEIDDFCVEYRAEKTVQAVKHVNLKLGRGEVLGLAGESGCGKSTLAYGVNRLLKPPAVVTSGRVVFNSREGTRLMCVRWKATTCACSVGRRFQWSSKAP